MKHLKNEQGAALVLTIMIITLILLFTLTLSYQVLNTTKQVDTMEENIDARSLAEMGVTYYQTYVEKQLDDKSYEDIDDDFDEFDDPDDLEELGIPESCGKNFNDGHSFGVKVNRIEHENEDDDDSDNGDDDNNEDESDDHEEDQFQIIFTSTGEAHGQLSKIEHQTITLTLD